MPEPSVSELRNCSKTLAEFQLWIFWAENYVAHDPVQVYAEFNEMADNDKWMLCSLVPVDSKLDRLLWQEFGKYDS